jgi:mono/diheme cytochrome c family protein
MKFAHVLVILLSPLLSSSLLAQHAPVAEKNPLAGNAAAAEAGKKTYVNSCQICHGAEAGQSPALATREFRHGGED